MHTYPYLIRIIYVGSGLSEWRVGLWRQKLRMVENIFLAQNQASSRSVESKLFLLVVFLPCCHAHILALYALFSGRCNNSRAFWPQQDRSIEKHNYRALKSTLNNERVRYLLYLPPTAVLDILRSTLRLSQKRRFSKCFRGRTCMFLSMFIFFNYLKKSKHLYQ